MYKRQDSLMAQTDAEYGNLVSQCLDNLYQDAAVFRLSRSWREDNPVRMEGLNPVSYTHLDVYKRQRNRTG